jgi:hypothetical protein
MRCRFAWKRLLISGLDTKGEEGSKKIINGEWWIVNYYLVGEEKEIEKPT